MTKKKKNTKNTHGYIDDIYIKIEPEKSEWTCHLFGGSGIQWHPDKGDVPNFFWRWMQYLIFGNKWIKVKK